MLLEGANRKLAKRPKGQTNNKVKKPLTVAKKHTRKPPNSPETKQTKYNYILLQTKGTK